MSRPLVVSVHAPADTVLLVRDGAVFHLRPHGWERLPEGSAAPGIGGHVLTSSQWDALRARVGEPS